MPLKVLGSGVGLVDPVLPQTDTLLTLVSQSTGWFSAQAGEQALYRGPALAYHRGSAFQFFLPNKSPFPKLGGWRPHCLSTNIYIYIYLEGV